MGAFDQAIPWSTEGARGCRRFLERVWRLQEMLTDGEGHSKGLETLIHQTIKKVSEDYEKMKFNTAIAQMMTLVNEFYAAGRITRGDLRTLLLLLDPVAPHIAEEMWQQCGLGEPIYRQQWPKWDEDKLQEATVEIAVQINGKVRGRVTVPAGMSREQAERELPQLPEVQRLIAGKTVKKIVCVPGRLLNVVVG